MPKGKGSRRIHALKRILDDLKRKALEVGRYGTPYTPERFDNRKKLGIKPSRNLAWTVTLKQINALQWTIDNLGDQISPKS